ncbi:hypothetical protein KIW84_070898 [Lathyrus oleraceus]|uniref:BLOC-1-related complex subunit 6 C-terminal helix domain-containing protein n=1 Tax=Pisum sativum TaxID=3888 RepID=A0A9D4VJB0_PEA|nr:hypothetical protein KIW84_070898 [Pisum sativum]
MGDTVEETNLSENSNPNPNPESESERENLTLDGTSFNTNNQREILKAIEVVERDSLAIAQSFTSVFEALRLSLSQSTDTSIHHIQCFADAAGHLQESVLDAATKGNRYINSCLKKILRRHVDVLDSAVNKLLHVS